MKCTCIQKTKLVFQGSQKLEPEQDMQTRFFAPVTLTWWPWCVNLT